MGTGALKNKTDIKIFILFLLDNINHPVDDTLLSEIIMENGAVASFDFQECLSELVDIGHVFADEAGKMKYYLISDKGHGIVAELYDEIDEGLRNRSLKAASRLIAQRLSGAEFSSSVEKQEGYYRLTLSVSDKRGGDLNILLNISSRDRADEIKSRFDENPEQVYRGIMSALTGEIDFLL